MNEIQKFVELDTAIGVIIVNIDAILCVQKHKFDNNICIITFTDIVGGYKGLEVNSSYYEISNLLRTKIR
jgi:hypothetical protein